MSYPIPPRYCVGCPAVATRCIGGADLCGECAEFAETVGETGVLVLMRTSPRQRERILAGELDAAVFAAPSGRVDGGPSFTERHGHAPGEPCPPTCHANPAKPGGNGGPSYLDSTIFTGPGFTPQAGPDYRLTPDGERY